MVWKALYISYMWYILPNLDGKWWKQEESCRRQIEEEVEESDRVFPCKPQESCYCFCLAIFSFLFLFFGWLAFALIGIIFQSIGHWPPPYLVDDIESIDVEILKWSNEWRHMNMDRLADGFVSKVSLFSLSTFHCPRTRTEPIRSLRRHVAIST